MHTNTQIRSKNNDKNINMEGLSNNGSGFRMSQNLSEDQLKADCYKNIWYI